MLPKSRFQITSELPEAKVKFYSFRNLSLFYRTQTPTTKISSTRNKMKPTRDENSIEGHVFQQPEA